MGIWQANERNYKTFQIASYLRVFTEHELKHMKWESRLQKTSYRHPSRASIRFLGGQRLTYSVIVGVNLLLGIAYMIAALRGQYAWLAAAIAILAVLITAAALNMLRSSFNSIVFDQSRFDREWIRIRNEESSMAS